MTEFGDTLIVLDTVGPEKALGVFVASVREAVPDAPECYFDLMAAKGAERRKLQRKCETHFSTLSVELRNAIRGSAIAKAQEIVQSPFERLASKMSASLERTSLDDLFPK
jgi:hypothetical protein